jgi:hypothetical protein
MGYSTSWIATKLPGEEVRALLRLEPTGEKTDFAELTLCDTTLPGGWYLLVANSCDFAERQSLSRLSQNCDLIVCSVEEHVMFSMASGWRNGEQIWWIEHDSEQGDEHLATFGDLPSRFTEIRDRLTHEQSEKGDADYIFDIPVEVACALTGYRHDVYGDAPDDQPFEVLRETKPWWAFWLRSKK